MRTKGAKDKQPRRMSANSLAALPQHVPGRSGVNCYVSGPTNDVQWFAGKLPQERGQIVSAARKLTESV